MKRGKVRDNLALKAPIDREIVTPILCHYDLSSQLRDVPYMENVYHVVSFGNENYPTHRVIGQRMARTTTIRQRHLNREFWKSHNKLIHFEIHSAQPILLNMRKFQTRFNLVPLAFNG